MPVTETSNSEKRKFVRVPYREPVHYTAMGGPDGFGGCVAYDISEGGLKLKLNDFIPLNAEIHLSVTLGPTTSTRTFALNGRVVWVQRVPFSEWYQVGVEFTNSQTEFKFKNKMLEYVRAFQ